jgi:crotonobetainyl-CoA:carnitine CoA-transferase CaiB-like acyl-CoA transferase
MGYGDKGPEKDKPGFDVTCFMARGGVFGTTVNRGDAPMIPTNGFGDFAVSIFLASGIAAALYNRTRTGVGDNIVIPLQHAGIYMLSTGIVSAQYGNEYPKKRTEVTNPFNNLYLCKDGKWVVMCLPEYDRDFNKVMTLFGRPDLVDNAELNICSQINANGLVEKVVAILDKAVSQFTLAEVLDMLQSNDCPCEPAQTPLDIYEDQNVWDNEMLTKIPYPSGDRFLPTNPVHFESMGKPNYKSNGKTGAQTREIMAEYGYSPEEIETAFINNAVKENIPLANPVPVK